MVRRRISGGKYGQCDRSITLISVGHFNTIVLWKEVSRCQAVCALILSPAEDDEAVDDGGYRGVDSTSS